MLGRYGGWEAVARWQTHPCGKQIRNAALKGRSEHVCAALESELWVASSHLLCKKAADTKEWLNPQEMTDSRNEQKGTGRITPMAAPAMQDTHEGAGGKMERSTADPYSTWSARALG